MEDLIIVLFFILASLASYINKVREKKQRERGTLEEQRDIEWVETVFEPDVKPPREVSPSAYTAGESPSKSQTPFEPEVKPVRDDLRSRYTTSEQSPRSRRPFDEEGAPQPLPSTAAPLSMPPHLAQDSTATQVKVMVSKNEFLNRARDNLQSLLSRSDSTSIAQRKKTAQHSVDLKSKLSLQKAILVREILDRPRAYDI